MNAVEIEEAVSKLAEQPFDTEEFPYAFLEAFGNKTTTIKRLRTGASNKSDLGGVLQTSNIHIKTCPSGEVTATLNMPIDMALSDRETVAVGILKLSVRHRCLMRACEAWVARSPQSIT